MGVGGRSFDRQGLRGLLLVVALVMGFVFLVVLSIYLVRERYGLSCGCGVSIPLIIGLLSSLGVFVGILTYYFLSKAFYREKEEIFGNVEKTLKFLDGDEKALLSALIESGGEAFQSDLARSAGLSPLKVHRRLSRLSSKGVVRKVKHGMTNKVVLDDDLKALFTE